MPDRPHLGRILPSLVLTLPLLALTAGGLAGCGDRRTPAASPIAARAERGPAPATAGAGPLPAAHFYPLSERPSQETLLALILADMLPAALDRHGSLPPSIERARGDVPNMARPMAYSITEPLAIDAGGRIVGGAVEVIDETDYADHGYFIFAFQPDGEITVENVSGKLPSLRWAAVAGQLPRPLTGTAMRSPS